jgi:hypothetical protein
MNLRQILIVLVGERGQGTLAESIGTNDSQLSRFRSDNGALSLEVLDKLLEVGGLEIVRKDDLKRMEDALEVITDLWKKARNS